MLRTKLLLAISASLAVVLAMTALLYCGPERMSRELDRSLLAHEQTEGYLRLSSDTYRHFWQLADQLIAAGPADVEERRTGRERIRARLQELERMTVDEFAIVGDSEPEERQEMLRLKRLAEAIAAGSVAFDRVAGEAAGTVARARELDRLKKNVDRDFAGLIDVAIVDERAETQRADDRVRAHATHLRSMASMLSVFAVVLICGLGIWLILSIKSPIERLMLGTQRIASGDLAHRIQIGGRDELAHLAGSFNLMAEDLERQRAALMEAQADLERKVRERTSELEQANLTLQRLDEVRRRMFADISHELRTPLTIISGEAEVTLRSDSVEAQDYRTALGRIVDLTGQVAKLVEDLMFLARSDTADLQIRRRPIASTTFLLETEEDLRALAKSDDIELALHLPANDNDRDGAVIDADPSRLSQLLLIIVDNACRYSEPGSRIDVRLEEGKGRVLIHVADHGIGIPDDELNAVFDRYFRGEQARHLAPRGVGLGLHVARTIAAAHDGTLSIDSKHGVGTTVTLSLPRHQADEDADAHSAD